MFREGNTEVSARVLAQSLPCEMKDGDPVLKDAQRPAKKPQVFEEIRIKKKRAGGHEEKITQ